MKTFNDIISEVREQNLISKYSSSDDISTQILWRYIDVSKITQKIDENIKLHEMRTRLYTGITYIIYEPTQNNFLLKNSKFSKNNETWSFVNESILLKWLPSGTDEWTVDNMMHPLADKLYKIKSIIYPIPTPLYIP